MMKKSKFFLFAYALALLFVTLLDWILKEGITEALAIAAAFASYFFSLSDLLEIDVKKQNKTIAIGC